MKIDSSIRNLCPDGANYRILQDARIEVDGEVIVSSDGDRKTMAGIQEKMGSLIEQASQAHDVPAAWIAGVILIESRGDPNACSPCIKKICSVAPDRCGGDCCAYGVMQCIDSTARSYCKRSGPSLMGDLEGGIDCGTRVFKDLLTRAKGDPVIAAKRYNGGGIVCGRGGIFGIGGQNNYVEKFVRGANTYAGLGAAPGVPGSEVVPVSLESKQASIPWWGWAAFVGIGAAIIYRDKL